MSLCSCGECRKCKNRTKAARYRERNRALVNARAREAAARDRRDSPEKVRAKKRRYYERNREAVLAKQRKAYAADPAHRLEINARVAEKRMLEKPDAVRAYKNAWRKQARQKNPEKERLRDRLSIARRRARLADACSDGVTPQQWVAVCARYEVGGIVLCAYCRTAPGVTIDHVIPIARGGKDEPSNVVPACKSCNCSKGAKLLDEWREAS